jgi:hypothetical protein
MLNKNIEIIDIKIDFADSEVPIYFCLREEKKLSVSIRTWNGKIIEFIFYNFLEFITTGGDCIKCFCVNKIQTEFFKEILEKQHKKQIPDNHLYKLYQLLDIHDKPYLEVISPYYEINII